MGPADILDYAYLPGGETGRLDVAASGGKEQAGGYEQQAIAEVRWFTAQRSGGWWNRQPLKLRLISKGNQVG